MRVPPCGRSPRVSSISNADLPQRHPDREFLPHVEGLRAVAVLAVLWYHVGLPGMSGGFVGVDIFFVISGFLITGLLLREHETAGRIDLRHFYSRRMRRILPAVLATIALTMVAAALVLAPLQMPGIAQDGAAAALSLGNMRFALESADYFAATDPSPFRHLWSLGVEEQFYLVWPALVIVALRAFQSRLGMALAIGALTVGSFTFALWLTEAFAPWAFYSLPSRLWELALGGFLAVAAGWLARLPALILISLGGLGVALVGAAVVVIDGATPYPGGAALLPTLGAAALIVGGGRGGPVSWVLTRRPARFVGRISYSLYLWHWPILVLPSLATGESLPLVLRCALGGVSVLVAAASWRLIEEPFRRGRLWTRRPRLVLATALTTAIAVAVFAIGIGDYSLGRVAAVGAAPSAPVAISGSPSTAAEAGANEARSGGAPGRPEATSVPPSPSAADASPEPSAPPSAPTIEPTVAPSATPPAEPTAVLHPWPLPADIRPALALARSDKERIIGDGCFMSLRGSKPPNCVYGYPEGSFTVALVGDSHAAHWFPAIEAIAKANGWRLLTFTKASCVFVDLPIYSPILKREYTECEAWRPLVVERLIDARPDLTIVSSDRWLPTQVKSDADPTRQGEAMARLLNQIPGAIAILGDTPASRVDVPVCLSRNLADITRCATSRIQAFGRQQLVRERAAARAADATVIDLSDAICPADPCQAVVGDTIVQRDDHHLTATFAASLAGQLEAALPIPR
ncbi:MAG: SGNH hydrolase domain-containing protein [Candidatus Limnocylindrales bacterium]|nr:SGNH hydrolase domain-containing protein [Candidatus Limnocylindrales bacterium]